MKKLLILPFLSLMVAFSACGPAAEERDDMLARSKVFQDSIANMIKAQMAEAEGPAVQQMVVPASPATAAATPSAPAK